MSCSISAEAPTAWGSPGGQAYCARCLWHWHPALSHGLTLVLSSSAAMPGLPKPRVSPTYLCLGWHFALTLVPSYSCFQGAPQHLMREAFPDLNRETRLAVPRRCPQSTCSMPYTAPGTRSASCSAALTTTPACWRVLPGTAAASPEKLLSKC